MRGGSFLRKPLPVMPQAVRNEAEAAVALGLTNTPAELQDTWFLCCESFTGEARERLQATYARQLRLFGALHG